MSTTTIYLMRHGHVLNPGNILYGRLSGFKLSELGIQQARTAGKWLADKPISAIYSSPMERARQTADIVAASHENLSPIVDERIIEVWTPHEGRPTAEMEAVGWDLYTGNQAPYESPRDVLERVLDFFEHVVNARAGESLVAVAHGDVLVFPWLYAQGVEPDVLLKDRLIEYALPVDYPDTASIMTFEFQAGPRDSLPQVAYTCPY